VKKKEPPQPPSTGAKVGFIVRASMFDLQKLSPQQGQAFMRGIAEVIAAAPPTTEETNDV